MAENRQKIPTSDQKSRLESNFKPNSSPKSKKQLENRDNQRKSLENGEINDKTLDSDEEEQHLSQNFSTLSVSQENQKSEENHLSNDLELEITEILKEENLNLDDLTSILHGVAQHSQICRICGKSGEILYPIFEEPKKNLGEISLLEKVQFYTPIKVKKDDNLPQNICDPCKKHLDNSCKFGIIALNTEASFRNFLEIQIDKTSLLDIASGNPAEKNENLTENGEKSTQNAENSTKKGECSEKNGENAKFALENSAEGNSNTEGQIDLYCQVKFNSSIDEEIFEFIHLNSSKNAQYSESIAKNAELMPENDKNEDSSAGEQKKLNSTEEFNFAADEESVMEFILDHSLKIGENSQFPLENPEFGQDCTETQELKAGEDVNSNSEEKLESLAGNENFMANNIAANEEIGANSQESSSNFENYGTAEDSDSQMSKKSSQKTLVAKTISTLSSLITDYEDEKNYASVGPEIESENVCRKKRLPSDSLEEESEVNPPKMRKIQEPAFEKWFKCNKCPASFQSEPAAIFHKNRHYLTIPVSQWCTYCSQEFPKSWKLTNHIFTEHKDEYKTLSEVFKCPKCHRLFAYRSNVLVHCLVDCASLPSKDFSEADVKEVSVKFSYTCEFCFKGFAYVTSLNEHRNQYHGPQQMTERQNGVFEYVIDKEEKRERLFELSTMKLAFVCKFCSKIFVAMNSYIDHLNEHIDGKFVCLACDEKFVFYEEVRRHRDRHDFRIILRQVMDETEDVRVDEWKEENSRARYKRLGKDIFRFTEERIAKSRLVISNSI